MALGILEIIFIIMIIVSGLIIMNTKEVNYGYFEFFIRSIG